MNLENKISKELLSHILGRQVYGFCSDNDKKDTIIKTTCYMLYKNLNRSEYIFNRLEIAQKIKQWIKNTSNEYGISSTNIHSGFDDEIYEDGYFCILGQGTKEEQKFYDIDDESFAIIEAGEFYLDKNYELYLHKDKDNWE